MALKVDLIRPDDLLNLQIECRNLKLDTSDRANPVLIAEDATQVAYLIVQFPPQTIAEEAVYEPRKEAENDLERQKIETSEERERREKSGGLLQTIETLLNQKPARARIAQPSRLVFRLLANSNPRIPYTTEGLLDWSKLELSVSAIADIPATPTDQQRADAPTISPPKDIETAIELPYRLILSPNSRVVWTHATALKRTYRALAHTISRSRRRSSR